ncbi:pterin 4 alpha carbinolamine dehydratase-domain-containing protein [Coniella lustricola]|uniref:4a-hydroxytetrahydrobiopterin dehydratase n=1 Tax=Coniella lustricola TaxID=2025994 RepID=A0A2T3AJ64_9PEZI|nr:pterin 4 alpha carbinolamine dehydratase-domain-containing protein [Coniella lustricola]
MPLHPLLRQPGSLAVLRPARQATATATATAAARKTTTTILATHRRAFSSTPAAMSSSSSLQTLPKFSEGSDETLLAQELETLQANKWSLTADGQGIERSFKFKTFAKTWDFMTAVSLQCKLKHHHPEWSNVYNTTFIRWTTHQPKGLSAQDTLLARKCDELARDFGEIHEATSNATNTNSGASCQLNALANGAGDCCVPKK